jgi:hypothetical protein
MQEKSKHKRKIKPQLTKRKTVRRRKHSIGKRLKKTYELNEEQAQEKHGFSDPQKPRVSAEAKIQEKPKVMPKKHKTKAKKRKPSKRQQKIDKIKTEMEKPIEKRIKKQNFFGAHRAKLSGRARKTKRTKKIRKAKPKRARKWKHKAKKPTVPKTHIEKRIKIEKPAPVIIAPPEPKREKPKLSAEDIRRQKKINKILQRPKIAATKTIKEQKIQPNSLSSFYRLQRIYNQQKKKEEEEKEEIKKALSK